MSFDKPIIVIIPGAFHKPDNYKLVTESPRSQGYKVLSAPLTVAGDSVRASLDQDDDASVLLAELVPKLDEDKEAILVSHSYGGVVVAASIGRQTVTKRQARTLKGGVRAVVNIASFAFPTRGKNIIGIDAPVNPMPYWLIKVT